MVTSLAKLFRISISKGHELITIEKEIQHAQSYLRIETFRYKNQFTYTFDVDENCLGYLCNKITLQPIIENAIYHGLNRMVDEGEITIRIREDGDDIILSVEDNGIGMTEEQCQEILRKEPGLMNALKVTGKELDKVKIVMNGAGAAAIAIAKLLITSGAKDVTMCDRAGAIYEGREAGMNPVKEEMAKITNLRKEQGSLADIVKGADVFIGVSAPKALTVDMVKTMNQDAIVFACANPTPEIFPDEAKAGGAKVVATGRSDFPNQINNVLAFPGIFRGALDVRARDINDEMKIAAAKALAGLISEEELNADYIIPAAFDERVGGTVAKAVAEAARKSGVARL